MKRGLTKVLPEAIIVGMISLIAYYILRRLGVKNSLNSFLIGFLLHLGFEYSPIGNINELWCRSVFT